MSDWVTVATAHAISLLYADDPMRAIGLAAASGGDTDTVACIVGAIVGARNGSRAISLSFPSILDAARVLCDEVINSLMGTTASVATTDDTAL